MKHLRRFDEELNPSTYRAAGKQLIHKFKEERGRKLVDYGDEKEFGFYNIYYANTSTKLASGMPMKFTKPKAEFYFQSFTPNSIDANGIPQIKYKTAEDLVSAWKRGDDLSLTINFRFKPTEEAKHQTGQHSNLTSYNAITSGVPIFSFRVEMSDWFTGIEDWNENADTGESMIGTEHEQYTLDMFENSFYPKIYLEKPLDKYYFGIFADRQSALKFKRELPKLIDPIQHMIFDVMSVIGADSEHIERMMDLFGKISINSLYEEDPNPKNSGNDLSSRWFKNNVIAIFSGFSHRN